MFTEFFILNVRNNFTCTLKGACCESSSSLAAGIERYLKTDKQRIFYYTVSWKYFACDFAFRDSAAVFMLTLMKKMCKIRYIQ